MQLIIGILISRLSRNIMFSYIVNSVGIIKNWQCKVLLLLLTMMIAGCTTVSNVPHTQAENSTRRDLYDKQFYLLAGLSEFNSIKAGNNQLVLAKSLPHLHSVVAKPMTKISQPVMTKVTQSQVSIPMPRQYYLPQPVASAARVASAAPVMRTPSMVSEPSTPMVVKRIMPTLPSWSAAQGQTLRQVVENWAQQAGYQLVWDANYDYPIRAKLQFNLPFIEAIQRLFNAYLFADRPFLVDVYQQQKLVYVRAKDA